MPGFKSSLNELGNETEWRKKITYFVHAYTMQLLAHYDKKHMKKPRNTFHKINWLWFLLGHEQNNLLVPKQPIDK